MTSASELFTARRASRGARLADPDPEPDPHADALRDPHGLAARRRRRGCRPRRQLDAAGDVRQHLHTGAPPPRRRGSYTVRSLTDLASSPLPLDCCRVACVVVGSVHPRRWLVEFVGMIRVQILACAQFLLIITVVIKFTHIGEHME